MRSSDTLLDGFFPVHSRTLGALMRIIVVGCSYSSIDTCPKAVWRVFYYLQGENLLHVQL